MSDNEDPFAAAGVQVGDRIRVTTVTETTVVGLGETSIDTDNGGYHRAGATRTVEVLSRAPKFKPGDVAAEGDGSLYMRYARGWFDPESCDMITDADNPNFTSNLTPVPRVPLTVEQIAAVLRNADERFPTAETFAAAIHAALSAGASGGAE